MGHALRQLKDLFLRGWAIWSPCTVLGVGSEGGAGRFAEALLGFGVFWSVAGVLLTPTMKFYNTLTLIFTYVPALWLVFSHHQDVARLLRARKELWVFLLLFGWAVLSLFWSVGGSEYLGKLLKQAALFVLLVFGWVLWGRASEQRLRYMLMAVVVVGGLYSVAALMLLPIHWGERLMGFGGFLDNPNPSAYSLAFILVMAVPLWPQRFWERLLWAGLLTAVLMFVLLCGSRGALLALVGTFFFCFVLIPDKRLRVFLILLLGISSALLLFLLPALWARGDSERLGLLQGSLALLQDHLWVGVGLGTDYFIKGSGGQLYGNSHNFLLNTAIQYGLPVLLLWGVLWGMIGINAWRCRRQRLGVTVLLLWVFSSIAMQFDVFTLWERSRAMWLVVWVPMLLSLCLEPVCGVVQELSPGDPNRQGLDRHLQSLQ